MTKAEDGPSVEYLTSELWGCLDAEQAARKAIDYMAPWLRTMPQDMPSVDELVEKLYPVIEENSDGFMRDGLSPSWHAWVKLLVESTVAELRPWLKTQESK